MEYEFIPNDAVPEAIIRRGMTKMRTYLVTLVYDRSVAGSGASLF